jgi:hypothetical protein
MSIHSTAAFLQMLDLTAAMTKVLIEKYLHSNISFLLFLSVSLTGNIGTMLWGGDWLRVLGGCGRAERWDAVH